MRLLFAAGEVFPFSKTGGLGDVMGALPGALAGLGHEVLVVSPWYAGLRGRAPLWIGDIDVPFDFGTSRVGVGTLEEAGVRYAFVGHESFRRERLYGWEDDERRFCLFTRAVPAVAARVGFRPDIVHVHDWHSSYLPLVLERGWHLPPGFPGLPSVLTVHNAQYQGLSDLDETIRWLRLPGELERWRLEHFGRANALKSGVLNAGHVTTVSPTYASELLTPEFGYTLEGAFRSRRNSLTGILNGLDTSVWDPASDPHLPVPYDAVELKGKSVARAELCRAAGLDPARPLLGVVSRLAHQKGIDLLLDGIEELVEQGWSLYVLGTGDVSLERRLLEASAGSPHVAATLEYHEGLAHLVYAASDALAIPSRFEPCGLSQLIAMRYGTLPIARETGGLRDTIRHGVTGFLFAGLEPGALLAAAAEAVRCYGTPVWDEMKRAAMAEDFSWDRSARRYEELYRGIMER